MKLIDIIDVDITNYKKISMFLITPYCSMKCNKDCGQCVCQNEHLLASHVLNYDDDKLVERYMSNPLTHAIVIGGMEPFDSFDSTYEFIIKLRQRCSDDVVIYSGYNEAEIEDKIEKLAGLGNVTVKFGRYRPGMEKHFDDGLGIYLASDNQYSRLLVS